MTSRLTPSSAVRRRGGAAVRPRGPQPALAQARALARAAPRGWPRGWPRCLPALPRGAGQRKPINHQPMKNGCQPAGPGHESRARCAPPALPVRHRRRASTAARQRAGFPRRAVSLGAAVRAVLAARARLPPAGRWVGNTTHRRVAGRPTPHSAGAPAPCVIFPRGRGLNAQGCTGNQFTVTHRKSHRAETDAETRAAGQRRRQAAASHTHFDLRVEPERAVIRQH